MRLQKLLADAGVASRRASEAIILAGRVQVNGQTVRKLGVSVDSKTDRVTLDGRPIQSREKAYLMLHKPVGYLCSRSDPGGRPLVGDLLPPMWRHLFTVGRLDFESEGLLLLTNDGEFSLRLTHPRYGVRKGYVVTLDRPLTPEQFEQLTRGVYVEGERLGAERVRPLPSAHNPRVLEIELVEGRYRELRRMFTTLGCTVQRLKRVRVGSLKLDRLPVGKWRRLAPAEVRALSGKP